MTSDTGHGRNKMMKKLTKQFQSNTDVTSANDQNVDEPLDDFEEPPEVSTPHQKVVTKLNGVVSELDDFEVQE